MAVPRRWRTVQLIATSAVTLAFGGLVYLVLRSPSDLFLFADRRIGWQRLAPPPWMSWFVGSIPTFCHALSFSLFSMAVLPPDVRTARLACLLWAIIDSGFELLQLLPSCPGWLSHSSSSIASMICAYCENGTFDRLDIAAAWAGSLVAYAISRCFT